MAPLLLVGFSYTFLLEKSHYLNHAYLFCWILLVLVFSPAWREWSVDVWRRPNERRRQIPFWTLGVPMFLMAIVYFFGGVAKINSDWLRAMPLQLWLQAKANSPLIGPLLEYPATAYFMAYGGLFLDLCVVPLLWWRHSRWYAFGMVIFFHFTNLLIFSIGIFPFLSIVLTSLFFPPDWPRRFLGYLGQRWPVLARWQEKYRLRMDNTKDQTLIWQNDPRWRGLVSSALGLLILIQVFLPLRHHIFGKDVAWDETGHRYAWRMMLRSKTGFATFLVVDQQGDTTRVRPAQELSRKQARKLATHPDMILQYAHHLREQYHAEAIYAEVKVKLNDGEYQTYINPKVNLAEEKWSFWGVPKWVVKQESCASGATID
jgi:hypothetical protein